MAWRARRQGMPARQHVQYCPWCESAHKGATALGAWLVPIRVASPIRLADPPSAFASPRPLTGDVVNVGLALLHAGHIVLQGGGQGRQAAASQHSARLPEQLTRAGKTAKKRLAPADLELC